MQKALSRSGLASRREVEAWIRAGRVTVNGEPVVLGARVTAADRVRLDGRLIHRRPSVEGAHVYICHRSPGESLSQATPAHEASAEPVTQAMVARRPLLDRLPRRGGRRFIAVSPMPRIDGGLELVTADGELAARLQRRVHSLVCEFSVRVHGELPESALAGVLEGRLDSGDTVAVERAEPAGGEGSNRWYTIVASGASGKDIRQLLERHGALVSRILRTRLGSLALDRHLARGRFRELAHAELEALL